MKSKHFDCRCNSAAHTLRVQYDGDDICVSMFLDHYLPWYKRAWRAFWYVLGIKPRKSHFDYWLLKPEDAQEFKAIIDEYLGEQENHNNMGFINS